MLHVSGQKRAVEAKWLSGSQCWASLQITSWAQFVTCLSKLSYNAKICLKVCVWTIMYLKFVICTSCLPQLVDSNSGPAESTLWSISVQWHHLVPAPSLAITIFFSFHQDSLSCRYILPSKPKLHIKLFVLILHQSRIYCLFIVFNCFYCSSLCRLMTWHCCISVHVSPADIIPSELAESSEPLWLFLKWCLHLFDMIF